MSSDIRPEDVSNRTVRCFPAFKWRMHYTNTVLPLLLLAALSSGCVHQYTADSITRSRLLGTNASALIAIPEDGRYEKVVYSGSGRLTALAVSKAFAKHLRRVDLISAPAPQATVLEAARAGRFEYLVVPNIVHWEDRATEWSGRPDRIVIEIRTIEAGTGETLAVGSVTGKSKWATFGGDAPEDLLTVPIRVYVDWLFAPEGTPLPEPREK